MYCDCVLGRAGFQPAYAPVLLISLVFVVAAVGMLLGGIRRGTLKDLESAKHQLVDIEE